MENGKEIELRSEEVQEVMGEVPVWIIRWGIAILFIVVLGLLVGSCFFKYPDMIEAEMVLTSQNPVSAVVARSSGKVCGLYVSDGQVVKEGVPLAVIENAAETEDVFRLKKLLARYAGEPERLGYYLSQDVWQLGDIQSAYTSLAAKDVAAQDYRASVGQLLAAIRHWEMNYCLMSSAAGHVQLLKQGFPNLYLSSGEVFCRIVPEECGKWIGRALLPIARSGKVKVGQRVIVRFSNFPDQEFGIVEGVVSLVSLVPVEDNYVVEITFPKGPLTNYEKMLPVSHEMTASAEIVTGELRLIERFFQPLRKILKEGF
ncbi:HlyD family efflux transporter periplasmic adaptor subunit [Parabacteroides sp. AM08-6]|uniref:HlyD family efflux transporter periplasmic adaptor subunit n=1 Tax=Parabacteroides sp. AM08-6 TaxID=2292053 RepID=UPI000EFFACFE|nr:HlyD family efflux transporter periplasmic adaptor subunit [Parabacteroides sp. AM08-6]RHJ81852.1 HlyD family efflux transporter periplasmic adaptor subunit [Parabacteroides sp. AM08-6]